MRDALQPLGRRQGQRLGTESRKAWRARRDLGQSTGPRAEEQCPRTHSWLGKGSKGGAKPNSWVQQHPTRTRHALKPHRT